MRRHFANVIKIMVRSFDKNCIITSLQREIVMKEILFSIFSLFCVSLRSENRITGTNGKIEEEQRTNTQNP